MNVIIVKHYAVIVAVGLFSLVSRGAGADPVELSFQSRSSLTIPLSGIERSILGHTQSLMARFDRQAVELGLYPMTVMLPNKVSIAVGDPPLRGAHADVSQFCAYFFHGGDTNSSPSIFLRETCFDNQKSLRENSRQLAAAVFHELIHWYQYKVNPWQEAWINEGLAMAITSVVTEREFGYPVVMAQSIADYLGDHGDVSLVSMPGNYHSGPNYGKLALFFEYLRVHYGGDELLWRLLATPRRGVQAVEELVYQLNFRQASTSGSLKFSSIFTYFVLSLVLHGSKNSRLKIDRDGKLSRWAIPLRKSATSWSSQCLTLAPWSEKVLASEPNGLTDLTWTATDGSENLFIYATRGDAEPIFWRANIGLIEAYEQLVIINASSKAQSVCWTNNK